MTPEILSYEEYEYRYPRVMARIDKELSQLFGKYMIDKGHEQISPALKEIMSNYLKNYYKKN